MEQVTRQIMAGQLAVGDQLESVAHLAKRLNVNPMTISKAYGFLVAESLVERRAGLGLFVRSVQQDKKKKVKKELLDKAMERAAALTVQLGLSAEEAQELFGQYFEKNKTNGEDAA